jgi:hypothetical protein
MDVLVRAQPEFGQYHNIGRRIVRYRAMGNDRNAVTAGKRFPGGRDDTHLETGPGRFRAHQRLPDIASGQKHVHHAVKGGTRGLRHGDNQNLHGIPAQACHDRTSI